MRLLQSLPQVLGSLAQQPLHLRRAHFAWDGTAGYWTPAAPFVTEPASFPLLLADVVRTRWRDDLRTETAELVLLYAEPHAENLADVPVIHARAQNALLELLLRLPGAADATLTDDPDLTYLHSLGPQRLAGISLVARLELPLELDVCC